MSETLTAEFACGDAEALITYLYGEGPAAERERVAAHLARCLACAEDVAALGSTREQLAAWTPPDQSLGFRITATDAAGPAAAERPAGTVLAFDTGRDSGHDTGRDKGSASRWWNQPLPAWAQMAAAVAIFATGMAMGGARHAVSPATPAAPATATARTATPVSTTPVSSTVSREDLAQLETRLRGEMAQVRTSAAAPTDGAATIKQVNQLIAQAELRQQRELALRVSDLSRDVQNQRILDARNFERRLAGVTDPMARRIMSNEIQLQRNVQPVALPGAGPFAP